MPLPRSVTSTTTRPFTAVARTSTSSPSGEYLTALSSRFASTRRRRTPSPRTSGRARGMRATTSTASWPRSAAATVSSTRPARSTSLNEYVKVPASMRDVSSTSPTSPASRSVSSAIRARKASRCSELSSRQRACSVRAEPITDAIGVRSSWETSETKSARIVERRRSSETVLGEHDRHAVEGHETAQLADEGAERLVHLERRAERACAAVRGVDQVGAPRELIAQAHRLLRPRARVQALHLEAPDEPADDQRDQHFEPDVEGDEVPAEDLVEVM